MVGHGAGPAAVRGRSRRLRDPLLDNLAHRTLFDLQDEISRPQSTVFDARRYSGYDYPFRQLEHRNRRNGVGKRDGSGSDEARVALVEGGESIGKGAVVLLRVPRRARDPFEPDQERLLGLRCAEVVLLPVERRDDLASEFEPDRFILQRLRSNRPAAEGNKQGQEQDG